MSRRKMGKISLNDLIILAKDRARDIDSSIGKVLEQDEIQSRKVAVDVLLFNNAIEEIYMRMLQREHKVRPSNFTFLNSLAETDFVPEEVLEAIKKLRDLRNRLAHSFDLLQSIFYVYSRNNYGLANMLKLKNIVKLIIYDIEETNFYINEAA